MKNVSCISRAGWSSAKFMEEKTCQSSSTSGPSASENPNLLNMSIISFLTIVNGWRVPNPIGYAVRVMSISETSLSFVAKEFLSSLILS